MALGCTGVTASGGVDWIGWDLDVGHGKTAYGSTFVAVQAARTIRDHVGHDTTEIRLSKSGSGVHIRTMLESVVDSTEAKSRAREIANVLGVRADPTALSRQAFWLWAAKPGKDGFRLIEPATSIC